MPATLIFPDRTSGARVSIDPAGASLAVGNRRTYQRHLAIDVPWLDRVRLKYGPSLRLVDLSRGGVQVEIVNDRLTPGRTVVCEIAAATGELVVPARVVRCHISRLSPRPTYRASLAFRRTLDLPQLDPSTARTMAPCDLAHEHARLLAALRDRASRRHIGLIKPEPRVPESAVSVPDAPLTAAMALLHAPAGRRAGVDFERELCDLFRVLRRGIEHDEPAEQLFVTVVERLMRVLRARVSYMIPTAADSVRGTVCFDVPALHRGAKLFVEFHDREAPSEWQFQLLKASVHLLGLLRDCEHRESTPADAPMTDQSVASPSDETRQLSASQPRVVVRYTDGRMLKGFSRDFVPARGYIEMTSQSSDQQGPAIRIPFGSLKAIFFVRDFEGNPRGVDNDPGEVAGARGRRLTVTFLDDEVMRGTTMNYHPDAPGFFITPARAGGNNERVFVVSRAIRHVQFA